MAGRLPESRQLLAVDLFAGCGGTSLGLKAAGFAIRAAVEVDPVAALSYQRNVGVMPMVMDIREIKGTELLRAAGLCRGECVLMSACPPCQGFSSQRRRVEGVCDPRNRLVLDVARLAAEVLPTYLLLENVPGLFNGAGRDVYDEFLDQMNKLGYKVTADLLNAADFGVPQHRLRLIALFRRRGTPHVALPKPTHGNLASRNGSCTPYKGSSNENPLPRWRTVRDAIIDLPALEAGQVDLTDPFHAAPAHSEQTLARLRAIPAGGSRADLPPDLALACHKKHTGHYDVYGRMRWDEPAPTLTGGCNKPSKGRFVHPEQHRAITLREAALLQGFPQQAWFAGDRDRVAEQIGNAVPPPLVAAIARPIAVSWRRARLWPHVRQPASVGATSGTSLPVFPISSPFQSYRPENDRA